MRGLIEKYRAFKQRRLLKKITKASKLVKNAKAIKEDRWAALEFLASLKDAEKTVLPLLERFEYSLEHGILDTREKELALQGIVDCGIEAIPSVKTHLKKTTKIAWPIKVIVKLGREQEVAEALKSALNFDDVAFDQLAVNKNYDILCYLRDYDLADFTDKIGHFLQDADERVRFASVEVLIEQKNDLIPGMLEPYLIDDTPENRRIKQSIVQAFVANQWQIKNKESFIDGKVADGFFLQQDGRLVSRR